MKGSYVPAVIPSDDRKILPFCVFFFFKSDMTHS